MKKMNFVKIAFVFVAFVFASCVSSKNGGESGEDGKSFFENGVYSYDFERVIENVQTESFYRASNVSYSMIQTKTEQGAAVIVRSRTFKIPELDDWLVIKDDGSIYSPTNSSVSGQATADGRIFWSGSFLQFDQVVRISEMALMLFVPKELRAPSAFNGSYKTEDGEWAISFSLLDGIAYADYGNFVVGNDGVFRSKFRMTIRQEVDGFLNSNTVAEFASEGKINDDASISYRVASGVNSTSNFAENAQVFSGKRISQKVEMEDNYGLMEIPENFEDDKKSPKWFSFEIKKSNGKIFACARESAHDKHTAKNIAIASALAEISAYKAVEVCAKTKISADDFGKNRTKLSEEIVLQSKSTQNFVVENEFFDEETQNAYVRVSVPE